MFELFLARFQDLAYRDGKFMTGLLNSANGKIFKADLMSADLGGWITLAEKMYALKNDISIRPNCSCGQSLNLNANGKLQKFCSPKCAAVSKSTKSKRSETNLSKYGTEHAAGSELVRAKIRETSLAVYGYEASWSAPKVREKAATTNMLRYGTENPANSDVIKKQISATHARRSVTEKQETRIKTESTTLLKYGEVHYTKTAEVKKQLSNRAKLRFLDGSFDEQMQKIKTDCSVIPVFTKADWSGYETKYMWQHLECGKQFEAAGRLHRGILCPYCRRKSGVQTVVEAMVSNTDLSYLVEDRNVISPLELDIYIPAKQLAIEVNGVYWHHDQSVSQPLIKKTELAEAAGIQLLHFWDFEIDEKPLVVHNIILAKLGLLPRLMARKLKVKVLKGGCPEFFKQWHLQGSAQASFTIGLFDNDKLVQAASFGHARFGKEELELIRFASAGVSVTGGFQRILAELRKKSYRTLITYADRRISVGDAYLRAGFKLIKTTRPNYFYVKGPVRLLRYQAMKSALPGIVKNFDASKTELENMRADGWLRCEDSGNLKFKLEL